MTSIPLSVTAAPILRKGQAHVYTPAGSDQQYMAVILRAHRDGSATIRLQWAIRNDVLLMGYHGDKFTVPASMLSARSATGKPVGQIKHKPA